MNLERLAKDTRGQANAVNTQIMLIVSLMVAIIVVYQLFISGVGPTTDALIDADAVGMLNTDMADNIGATGVTEWDNTVENAAVNAWNASGYVTTTVSDNGDGDSDGVSEMENGFFYQALVISTVGDGVTTATVSARYRLIDNDNIETITSTVVLDDGTDNTTIWSSTSVVESATWTSIENSVLTTVDAAGTYTLFIRTNITPDNDEPDANIIVAWDDVNLSVVAETADNPNYSSTALAAWNNVQVLAWAGIGLMAIVIIILAAAVLMQVIRGGFGGGGV